MPQNAASDQGLHCLLIECSFKIWIKIKTTTQQPIKTEMDIVQLIRERNSIRHKQVNMSRDMRFPTMWYVRPAKAPTSLRMRAVWSEPLLVAWIFYSFGVSKLKRRLHRLVSVYSCQMPHCWKSHVTAHTILWTILLITFSDSTIYDLPTIYPLWFRDFGRKRDDCFSENECLLHITIVQIYTWNGMYNHGMSIILLLTHQGSCYWFWTGVNEIWKNTDVLSEIGKINVTYIISKHINNFMISFSCYTWIYPVRKTV